jgi:dolichol-phosphate mannosyltransferase
MLRIGRRGLSTACIEGMLAASSPLVAVMDADLQHDETRLRPMFELLRDPELDIVVGSRYVEQGSIGDWGRVRALVSRWATSLSRTVLKADLRDPMSGFFMIRREAMLGCVRAGISGVGFKILLDLFASAPTPLRFREIPYTFRERHSGHSKLDSNVAWEYLLMLLDRMLGGWVPIRFIAFSIVGALGLGVHMAVLALLFRGFGSGFVAAQTAATLVAMTSNFALNNLLTYRDMRLRGWGLLRGWISFVAACSIGGLANVGIAAWLFQQQGGWIVPAAAGVLVGAVWNYALTALYTWRRPTPRRKMPAPASGQAELTRPVAAPPGLS